MNREGNLTMISDYRNKFVTPEIAAAKAVQSGDWVDYGFGAGFPELMDKALAGRKGELKDVKIRGGLVIRPRIEVVECDPEQSSFSYYSWHIGDYERKLQSRGLCQFIPMILRSLPELYRKHIRVDVAFVPVSTPDDNGYCGLGISNYAWRTILVPLCLKLMSICRNFTGWTAPTGCICRRLTLLWRANTNRFLCALTGNPPLLMWKSPDMW